MKYAQGTSVSVEKSKAEIERTVSRYGATQFGSGWKADAALITFEMHGRRLRFILPLPRKDSEEFVSSRRGRRRPEMALTLWEQSCRQKWRALALAVKAKLEVVESGISAFEDEFMAHIVLPDGQTVSEWMGPQIAAAYQSGTMPPLLPYMPQ